MQNQLYPLKFTPIVKDKIWGGDKLKNVLNKISDKNNLGESWELSGVKGDVSVVSNGFLKGNALDELIEVYMGDLVGEPIYKKFGNEFPLLFKFIDAKDDLSIQVHPNDELSKKRHNAFGKTEMWYVVDAEPKSKLLSGFVKPSNKDEYVENLEGGKLIDLLKWHEVNPGDSFFIPAGNVHAIGKGVLVAEIQQTSDVTYRIYDYDRMDDEGNLRELHTELALDAIDYTNSNDKINYELKQDKSSLLASCEYFTTNVIDLKSVYKRDIYVLNSFVVYMCIEGNATITSKNNEQENISKGETILIPAAIDEVTIEGDAKLLEVFIKN